MGFFDDIKKGIGDALDPSMEWAGGYGLGGSQDPIFGGKAAADAEDAAALEAQGIMNEQAYLQEINKVPQAFLESAMQQYGGYFGIGYDPETGQATKIDPTMPTEEERIGLAESSPLYASIMGSQQAGEEAIARSASATSGLRGGGTAAELAGFGKDLKNEALMTSYNEQVRQEQQKQQGLGTLMGQPTYSTQIGQTMSNIGSTMAQGKIAGAQAKSEGIGNAMNLGGMIGVAALSDMRLKENINKISDTTHPEISVYEWDWAEKSGKSGIDDGFLAQEIEKVWPDLVIEGDDGYKRILKTEIENRLKELT